MSEKSDLVTVLRMPKSEAHMTFVDALGDLAIEAGAVGAWFTVTCQVRVDVDEDGNGVHVRRLSMIGPEADEQ